MLIVDGIIYSLQRNGGISVYFNELRSRLKQNKISFKTITYSGSNVTSESLNQIDEVRVPRLAERYRNCPVSEDAEIFHSSYFRLPSKRVATVTTVHDFTYERLFSGPRKLLHSWQKFKAIRRSQAIICISESTKQDLLYFLPDVDESRVHVVYNGVGSEFFPLKSISDTLNRPFVLFVGSRVGYKNFMITVKALTHFPSMDLVFVGGGPLNGEEKYYIQKCIGMRYKHYSFVSSKQLNLLYNTAYCLAYPSAYEGFGIPILEAMRAGCPVITVNRSSMPEVAGVAAIMLADPDVDELVKAIYCLENKSFRNDLRKLGFEQSAKFSWQETFEQTIRIYRDISDKPFLIN